jgi:glycosyltransferase involved in cell wall biosynthesis
MFRKERFKVHVVKIPRRITPLVDLLVLKELFTLMKRERFTIVHTHTPKIELIGQMAARFAGVPVVVYTNHGLFFRREMSWIKRRVIMGMAKLAGYFSDHVLSQSKEDIGTALQEKLYRSNQITYLGNGVDLARYGADNFTPESIRKKKDELGIPAHSRVIGMVGRYVIEKGYREFFQAAKQISQRYSDVVFLTVGLEVPEERDPIEQHLIEKLGIANRVVKLSSRHDMPELYSIMDVLVSASFREGFPRSLIEGAAMSLPVIATDIPGCREALVDQISGYLVPVKDSQSLAGKIELLLKDAGLRRQMGVNGRELAKRNFDQADVITRLKNCYRQKLREKDGKFQPGIRRAEGEEVEI